MRLPPRLYPLLLTDGRTLLRLIPDADRRPNPPERTCFEGFFAWKLFCDCVGFRRGALTVAAFFPEFGDFTRLLMPLNFDRYSVLLPATLSERGLYVECGTD